MEEEGIQNNPYDQVNQGRHSYIELWFLTITDQEHHSLQQYLALSKSMQLVSHIQVHVKAHVSILHMILSIIFLCTWLHWKYSYI